MLHTPTPPKRSSRTRVRQPHAATHCMASKEPHRKRGSHASIPTNFSPKPRNYALAHTHTSGATAGAAQVPAHTVTSAPRQSDYTLAQSRPRATQQSSEDHRPAQAACFITSSQPSACWGDATHQHRHTCSSDARSTGYIASTQRCDLGAVHDTFPAAASSPMQKVAPSFLDTARLTPPLLQNALAPNLRWGIV